jgi:hypothetical protein
VIQQNQAVNTRLDGCSSHALSPPESAGCGCRVCMSCDARCGSISPGRMWPCKHSCARTSQTRSLVDLALYLLSAATCYAIHRIKFVSSTTGVEAWISLTHTPDSLTLVADRPAVCMAHVVVTPHGLHEVIVTCLLLLAETLRVSVWPTWVLDGCKTPSVDRSLPV